MNELRWVLLMESFGIDKNIDTFNELLSKYSEKHRSYHNKSHIEAVLKHLDHVKHLADDAALIEIALWFHDAIYKIYSSTNELDSAKWAVAFLKKNSVNKATSNKVYSLIMSTLHEATPEGNDEQLMVDIDLAILGSESKIFQQFEIWIREEYKLVPSFIYKKKRKEILSGFLERERIYSHDYFHSKFEVNARFNISNAIKKL